MEHRIILSKKEAAELTEKLTILNVAYVKDVYTGTKRVRTDPSGTKEKDYETPVTGVIHRFSSQCELDGNSGIWFEYKWTEKTDRFEIEFEQDVPTEFRDRENVIGWDILTN